MDVKEEQANRFNYLDAAWQVSKGSTKAFIKRREFEKVLGMETQAAARAREFLRNEGLIEQRTLDTFSITHLGIKEMEAAHNEPDQATAHFPPMNHIIIITGNVTNSTIQQAGDNAIQNASVTVENKQELGENLAKLMEEVLKSNLPEEDRDDVAAQIATMQAQLKAKEPDKSILQKAWASVKRVLEGAAGGLVTAGALALIPIIAAILA